MKPAILATILSTCIAGQAAALSCVPASAAASFQAASASDAQYVLALGRVQILPGQSRPEPDADPNNRQGYTLAAQFSGRIGGPEGFVQEATFPVTFEVQCTGAWCGGVPVSRVVAFIERRENENLLVDGPCPLFTLNATPAVVEAAEACLEGGPCEAPVQ